METKLKPQASLGKTNDIIFKLIKNKIDSSEKNCKILDFGAGKGYMSQRIGEYIISLRYMNYELSNNLFACEITPEYFTYDKIDCKKILPNSILPYDDNFFDLINAIEVVEHMPRPYDFFNQAYLKLKKDGILIFSVPNILHFKSRINFLLTGYHEMYGGLSAKDENAGRICGHIMPLSYTNFHYGLRKAGFNDIQFTIDKRKRGALIPSILMFPILKFSSFIAEKNLKKYDKDVHRENQDIVKQLNSLDLLSSRSCIVIAKK